MLISDTIAAFIEEMLDGCGGTLEIKRNDLAKRLGCVPSQINYVVASRFTPERGYIIESRRGGGGYMRIARKSVDGDEAPQKAFAAVGDALSECAMHSMLDTLYAADLITAREKKFIRASLSGAALGALPHGEQDKTRAAAFRSFLLSLMK